MSSSYGSYGYDNPHYPSVGSWLSERWAELWEKPTTYGEQLKKALAQEGLALFMAIREQIMQPAPQNRMVIRPSVSTGVGAWWQTSVQPLFSYFVDWLRRGPLPNVGSWAMRLTQLRREAAQLGLLVLPSAFFDAFDAAAASRRAGGDQGMIVGAEVDESIEHLHADVMEFGQVLRDLVFMPDTWSLRPNVHPDRYNFYRVTWAPFMSAWLLWRSQKRDIPWQTLPGSGTEGELYAFRVRFVKALTEAVRDGLVSGTGYTQPGWTGVRG